MSNVRERARVEELGSSRSVLLQREKWQVAGMAGGWRENEKTREIMVENGPLFRTQCRFLRGSGGRTWHNQVAAQTNYF